MSTTQIARAWSIRRSDGLTLGFTDHDAQLHFGGIPFRPDSGMTARALIQGSGLSVDNSEAEGALTDDGITERDLLAGRWDNAELRMWEVDWSVPTNRRLVFRGSLGEVSRSSGAFRAELRGLSEPLNAPQGRVYHPRCSARVGDVACGVDLTADGRFVERQVEVCEEGRLFRFAAFPSFDSGWFERGVLLVLNGQAEELHGGIKNDLALPGGQREIELWQSLGITPQPGNRIRLTAGCNKRAETCRAKFNNFLNFRGFPHLPAEDWLIAPRVEDRRE